ncbi:MAG: sigma-70 family RNA polymerase sigma factor [Pedosphaera sp.]|nr:sigma-70 family RNA polymerase sigma factor [Pedosphaera sp.]
MLRAGDEADSQAMSALEQLCRAYWYPLYAYIRRQGRGPEEAQDLTQEFFARLLSRGSLSDVSREKGRFRSFLLASMNHFLADDWDHAHRQKRGGGATIIPLDAMEAEERYRFEPVDRLDAARLFDRRWAMTVLEQAIARLEAEFNERPKVFAALQSFLVGDGDGRTQADVARELGLSDEAVRATISRMRKRCRELVREQIAQTVASISEVEDEYRALLSALRS